jgi:ABC-2 type transport system ATP-binding protein
VLILDEPVSALDPIGRKEMFDIINSLKGKVTVIFSSHVLTDVERICDHIILINNGKIILNSSIKDMAFEKKNLLVSFKCREDLMKIKERIEYPTKFSERIQDCLDIQCDDIFKVQKELFSLLVEEEVEVKYISISSDSLEDIFLREVKKNG